MRLLAFINESKTLSDEQVATMAEACTFQLARHACPAWKMPLLVCFPRKLADISGIDIVPRLVFLDHSDQADALGYHSVGPDGLPYAKVFVEPILDSGGAILLDPRHTGNVVSVCASHETLEILGDPGADWWRHGPQLPEGAEYALELCDPVQDDSYEVPTARGMVCVSDFVLPRYFGEPGRGVDYLGKLATPWTVAPGGYLIIKNDAGDVQDVFGHSRHAPHPASRLARRRAKAA